MKRFFPVALIIWALLFSSLQSMGQNEKGTINESFVVLGECYLCLVRIEDAAHSVTGCLSAGWNTTTKILKVTYDDQITTVEEIAWAVASVGHDNLYYQAPQEAYDSLVGTCCEYDRTLTYTGVPLLSKDKEISIYPNPVTDHCQLKAGSQMTEEIAFTVYDIRGEAITEGVMRANENVDLDCSFMEPGNYLIHFFEGENTYCTRKLIKR